MNQTEFATAIGTKPSSVSKWESGKTRPVPEIFIRIAKICRGPEKPFFLSEAGIPFNAAGEVDMERLPHESGKSEIIAIHRVNTQKRLGRPSQPESIYTWDPDLLVYSIEVIGKGLKRARRSLPPRKLANVAVLLYEECQRNGRKNAEMVAEQLIKRIA